MRALEIGLTETVNPSREIKRYVDAKGAQSYLRHNAMIGRVRHWLPKQLTGLDKIYAKTGLSFTFDGVRSNWNAYGESAICFVIDQSQLANHIVNIDGDAVFNFSHEYDLCRFGMSAHNLTHSRTKAIEDSLAHPDEAFVIGDIRGLASKLIRIELGPAVSPKFAGTVRQWGELHGVAVV